MLIPNGLIQDRVEKLADEIFTDIQRRGQEPINILVVLKGGYQFHSDLQEKLNMLNAHSTNNSVQISVDFIRLKSYENTSSSKAEIKVMGLDTLKALEGKNVLVVEDIVDTGRTIRRLLALLKEEAKPKSIRVACLLRKRTDLSDRFVPDYVGFEIPDRFVIGHGFDYNEYFRDIQHICVINNNGIEKYKS